MLATLCILVAAQSPLVFERIVDPSPSGPLSQAVGVTGRAGDDRLFVTLLGGTVRIARGGAADPQPFLDISGRVASSGLTGLRAMAFHPAYDANGYVYLWYDAPTGAGGPDLVLARMTRSSLDPDRVDPTTHAELLRLSQDDRGHGGGALAFASDGTLWIGAGDGGIPNDPGCRAQDPLDLFGKLLRIDVDGAFPYAIPADNPFASDPSYAPEIAHVGFRHPWKWSFDRVTGDLWIGDVGQQDREELNFAAASTLGMNFGWPVMEGELCHPSAACPSSYPLCGDPIYAAPAFAYDHGQGCAITAGFVYRGNDVPSMVGLHVSTDFCTGRTWTTRRTSSGFVTDERTLVLTPAGAPSVGVSSFGEDAHGELLLLDHGSGAVYRMIAASATQAVCVGELNSVGRRGILRYFGSTSISANDGSVGLTNLPPLTAALLVMGPEEARVPVAGGTLCVGGSIVRLYVGFANQAGLAAFPLDLTQPRFQTGPGALAPGTSMTFQAWYRDVGGPLGANSNFTGATRATFWP